MKKLYDNSPVWIRKIIFILCDILLVNFAIYFSVCLRLGFNDSVLEFHDLLIRRIPVVTIIYIALFCAFSLYRSIWEFAGAREVLQVGAATLTGTVLTYLFDYFVLGSMLPRTSYLIAWPILLLFIGGLRLAYRCLRRISVRINKNKNTTNAENKRLMIVGAGQMGYIMIRELLNNNYQYGVPVLCIDDDRGKVGKILDGVPVKGSSADIPALAEKYNIDEIVLCIPSISDEDKRRILKIAMSTGCELTITPSVHELASADFHINRVRKVEISDLLSRPEVKLDKDVCKYLTDQVVLVTGGGGSIGSELCRQAACYHPKQIIIFDIYENNAYELMNDLKETYGKNLDIQVRIGSVRDAKRLDEIFNEFRPSVVFHAAAHKHVPLMEDSPCEAIKNNVFGTYNTALCADKYHVRKFVLLSTDKAVNPTNVMGATKRITELVIQYMDRHSDTDFAAVRFGNVLGSNGSVIPLFQRQIERGGPVTVTHPDITRYFMTIPEAAQLVVQAGGLARGGEIFVLDMGEPVKIVTLAENLIRLSGFEPDVEIKIDFTGLRPGEKLFEELTLEEEMEGRITTKNHKIFITKPVEMNDKQFLHKLDALKFVNADNVRELIQDIVPNYHEPDNIVTITPVQAPSAQGTAPVSQREEVIAE